MKNLNALFSNTRTNRAAMVAALAVAPLASKAAAGDIDTASITAALTSAGTACAAVGAAYLIVVVGIKAYKLIQKSL